MTEPEQPQYPYEQPPAPYQPPPYGQQPPPYGQQPYGQPGYGQQPWQPGPPPPPPARRSSRMPWIIAAIVVVAAVAIGAVVFALAKDDKKGGTKDGGGGPVALPETFAGYTLIHGGRADSVEKAIRSLWENTPAKVLSDKATIGTYAEGSGGTPALIGVTFPASLKGTVGGASSSDDGVASELLSYAGTETDSFDPGSHGGALRCAQATMGATEEMACAWSDDKVIGMTIVPGSALTEDELAKVTNQLRDKVG